MALTIYRYRYSEKVASPKDADQYETPRHTALEQFCPGYVLARSQQARGLGFQRVLDGHGWQPHEILTAQRWKLDSKREGAFCGMIRFVPQYFKLVTHHTQNTSEQTFSGLSTLKFCHHRDHQ